MNKKIVIIGGGTTFPIRSHLGLIGTTAFGTTARKIKDLCKEKFQDKFDIALHLTRMAGGEKNLETNQDIKRLVEEINDDPSVRIVFFNASMCDWEGTVLGKPSGKYEERISTKCGKISIQCTPAEKVISLIRSGQNPRKDIFLVGFKHSSGLSEQDQYVAGLNLLKESSCNLVLANDSLTKLGMIIVPEEAKYCVTTDRTILLRELVDITEARTHMNFTQSTVVGNKGTPWDSNEIPDSLRKVVEYCIKENAYKPFRGSTAGHFAFKVNDTTFITSKRKSDFNKIYETGMIKCVTDGPDSVLAYGGKPSVGGQSQRIVFKDHPGYDCIVHFHTPIKPESKVPIVSQREFECGSHECGKNTSNGLKDFGGILAVYLDNHGPNIVFKKKENPQRIIDFIEENFYLNMKTGGYTR